MSENKDTEKLCDLLESGESKRNTLSEECPENRRAYDCLRRIVIDPEIMAYAESKRCEIHQSLHFKIEKLIRRRQRIYMSAVAATILSLFLISNFYAYRIGYHRINSQTVTLNNPLGVKGSVMLSDGSKVTLNAGSTLIYPTVFIGKERTVKIEGEAFFEVEHDGKRPFIVQTEALSVKVLGTAFNVNAYKDEEAIEVALSQGIVEITTLEGNKKERLTAGQFVRFDKQDKTLKKKKVDLQHYIAWKEGSLYFNSVPLGKIARQLERHFNVRITIGSESLKQTVFSGDFIRGENIEQILQVITFDKRIRYKIEGDQIFIEKK